MSHVWRFLVWLDRTVNDKWFRGRWETISGRCWRRMVTKNCRWCTWLCHLLDKIDPDHCRKAHEHDASTAAYLLREQRRES